MATPQEGILAYTQPSSSAMPSAYYPEAYPYAAEKESGSGGLMVATGILLLLFIIWFVYYMSPARVLTRRLIRAGWVLYTRPGCPYCVRQENVLRGKFWKRISCRGGKAESGYTSHPPLKCNDPSITGFPYWYNHLSPAKSSAGLKNWQQLQKMAGH